MHTGIVQFDLRTEGQSPKPLYRTILSPKRRAVAERMLLNLQTDGLIVRLTTNVGNTRSSR